jgi:AraC-like DNA-binding protein
MSADLLALLEQTRPDLSPAERLALIADTPDARAPEKPVRRVVGARPRTAASVERRRSLASQGWFPPAIAARFTVGEQAALAVIAQEVARHETCSLFIEKIAALAGVTRSTVKRALKEAHGLGMIRIEERRLTGWRNDANVITILDPGWLTWLRMRRKGEGSRKGPARNTKISNLVESRSTSAAQKGLRRAEGRVRWRETGAEWAVEGCKRMP